MFVEGFEVQGRSYAGGTFDWVQPFPLLTGVGLVAGYVLLGATWLVMKTEDDLQAWARRAAGVGLAGVLAFIAMVSIWTPLAHAEIAARWFAWPNFLYLAPVPLLVILAIIRLGIAIDRREERAPFLLTLLLFLLSYAGLAISLFPYIVPPSIAIWDAAAPHSSQAFMLVGTVILLPIILAYTGYNYWVFRGKVTPDSGYHH
jgi:cytochrome bd ubiquinol oxidase subunit II